jgi:hypothetical protein
LARKCVAFADADRCREQVSVSTLAHRGTRGRRGGVGSLDGGLRAVLIATCAANAIVFFNQTSVTVALPAIQRGLNARNEQDQQPRLQRTTAATPEP